jgi:hypothetical protein
MEVDEEVNEAEEMAPVDSDEEELMRDEDMDEFEEGLDRVHEEEEAFEPAPLPRTPAAVGNKHPLLRCSANIVIRYTRTASSIHLNRKGVRQLPEDPLRVLADLLFGYNVHYNRLSALRDD